MTSGKLLGNTQANVAAADDQDSRFTKRLVSYQVTLKTSGKQFTVQKDETLLEAALQQGITLPYGCKNGACGSCKGKVLEGQVEHGQHSAAALSPTDDAAPTPNQISSSRLAKFKALAILRFAKSLVV